MFVIDYSSRYLRKEAMKLVNGKGGMSRHLLRVALVLQFYKY